MIKIKLKEQPEAFYKGRMKGIEECIENIPENNFTGLGSEYNKGRFDGFDECRTQTLAKLNLLKNK